MNLDLPTNSEIDEMSDVARVVAAYNAASKAITSSLFRLMDLKEGLSTEDAVPIDRELRRLTLKQVDLTADLTNALANTTQIKAPTPEQVKELRDAVAALFVYNETAKGVLEIERKAADLAEGALSDA